MARFAVLQHVGYESLQSIQHPVEVHPHHPVPVRVGSLPDAGAGCARAAGDSCVVAQDVHVSEFADGLCGQGLDRLFDHGIGYYPKHIRLALPQLFDRPFKGLFFDVGKDDLHPRLRESFGERQADAAGGARHDRRLAFKLVHVLPSPVAHGSFVDDHAAHLDAPTVGCV